MHCLNHAHMKGHLLTALATLHCFRGRVLFLFTDMVVMAIHLSGAAMDALCRVQRGGHFSLFTDFVVMAIYLSGAPMQCTI